MTVQRAKLPIAALLLTCLFAASATIACAIGRTQPPPEILRQLHLTDCALPCWIGILPKETTIDEAYERIDETFSQWEVLREFNNISVHFLDPSFTAFIWLEPDYHGQVVEFVDIVSPVPRQLLVGDVAAWFGSPCFTEVAYYASHGIAVAQIRELADSETIWRRSVDSIRIRYGSLPDCP